MLFVARMVLVAVLLITTLVLPMAPRAAASVPAFRQADPVVIDFDELTTTSPGTGGQMVVSDQYASLGVTFNDPKVLDYANGSSGAPGFAHSGANAIQQCYSEEFCETPLVMTFTEPQQRVKVWVGFRVGLDEAATVELTAFDAPGGGEAIASASATLGPSDDPRIPVQTPLEVTTEAAPIRRVEVGFSPASDAASFLVFDDVEFEAAAAPAVCTSETPAPSIVLEQPASGWSTQQNEFTLQGRTTATEVLEEATLTATGRAGTRAMDITADLLTADLLTPDNDAFAKSIEDLLLPGSNTISVAVRTCAGTATARTVVSYTPIADDTRYVLQGVEVTQTIQDLENSVPLIAGKRTFVRVYLRTTEETPVIRNVSAVLPACLDPTGGPPNCLSEDAEFVAIPSYTGTTIDDLPDLATKRRKTTSGLTFELPAALTAAGQLHLALNDLTLSPALPCENCATFIPGGLSSHLFQEAPALRVNLVDVSYTVDGETYSPLPIHRARLESWLRRAYPTNEVIPVTDLVGMPIQDGLPACEEVSDRLFEALKIVENQAPETPLDPRTRYYALVSADGGFANGCYPGTRHFASGPAGSGNADFWDRDGTYADYYGGHEVAHTFGRKHPGACRGNGRVDEKSPVYPDGTLVEKGHWFFGFDSGDASIRENIIVSKPYEADLWTDLLTYCDNRWISSYTYRAILDQTILEDVPAPEEAPHDVAILAAEQPGQEVLLVVGTINLDQDTVELRPFSRLPGDNLTPRPTTSDFTIVLQDDLGVDLETYPFEPRIYVDTPAIADRTAQLGEVVRWVPKTERISIRRLGQEIAFRPVSEHAPRVQLTSPNGGELLQGASHTATWTASDTDCDVLTSSLLYSTDKGATWRSVAAGIRDRQYTVDLSRLPGSDTALYRVIATDGVNTGQDDSDALFSVSPKAPEVGIISPADGTSFGTSHTIVLVGTAYDLELGNLDGASLQWSSDRQGALGEGRSISVSDLAPGFHTISLAATDDDGMATTTSILLEIVDDELPTLAWDSSIDISHVPHGQFFYDRDAGIGTFYASNGEDGMQHLSTIDPLLNGWTGIVPGNFGGDDQLTDLLLYASQTGLGEFYASDGDGGLRLLSNTAGFTRGWDLIVPGDFGGDDEWTDLFFYDAREGIGKFYTTDGEGRIRLLGTPEKFLAGWTSIVAGDFGGDGHTDLLFYDKATGLARFYASDGLGGLELLSEDSAWATGWDQIVPGMFEGNDDWTDLFFSDDETGDVAFSATDGQGGIDPLGSLDRLLARWTTIIGGDFGGDDALTDLFFYDGGAGRGTFYQTDGSGGLEQLSSTDDFTKGWDLIVPGHFGGS